MIDLYYWPTPNGRKIPIFLEEANLGYNLCPIDIHRGEQFSADFLEISPGNRIPAIVDHEGPGGARVSVFESGAILMYLAEKTGQLLPSDPVGRHQVTQWLMFQVGSIGPMFGQRNHFRLAAPEPIAYAIERYTNETRRLLGVLDRRLAKAEFLGGDYSIADIATYPWIEVGIRHDPEQLAARPHLARWLRTIAARPGVQRGMQLLADQSKKPLDDEARSVLYGKRQFQLASTGTGQRD